MRGSNIDLVHLDGVVSLDITEDPRIDFMILI